MTSTLGKEDSLEHEKDYVCACLQFLVGTGERLTVVSLAGQIRLVAGNIIHLALRSLLVTIASFTRVRIAHTLIAT